MVEDCCNVCAVFVCHAAVFSFFFFFQAEDGIRDVAVTGVQTCALPISGPGQFGHPWGIAVSAAGDVMVSDEDHHRIERFSSTGAYLGEFGGPGSGPGEFNIPTGMCFDVVGSLYVCDELNNRVQKFSNTGAFLSQWGSFGSADGQFYNDWAVLSTQ